MLPFDHRQTNPACGKGAAELAVGEERDVPPLIDKTCYDSIRTIGDLRGHFAAGTAVAKQIPPRSLLPDFRSLLSLVSTIVPFGQIRLNFGQDRQPRQLACSSGAFPWACQHTRKRKFPQPNSELARLILALRGQWKVRVTCVSARERPFRLAMPDKV